MTDIVRAVCPGCGKSHRVTVAGVFSRHRRGQDTCPGAGQRPPRQHHPTRPAPGRVRPHRAATARRPRSRTLLRRRLLRPPIHRLATVPQRTPLAPRLRPPHGRPGRTNPHLRPRGVSMTTHTRVHVYVSFANPFLVCDLCRQPVPRWHNNDKCGCGEPSWNDPCEHAFGIVDTCPSWSPVDGCQCQQVLGCVDHSAAPTNTPA